MVNIEQKRAAKAFDFADRNKNSKEYGSHVKKAPMYILNNGLVNFLAFAHQKGGDWEKLSTNLKEWFKEHDPQHILKDKLTGNTDPFVKTIATLGDDELLRLVTLEALQILAWLRRFVTAE
jgi:CRISPR-associated protein Cmr5